MQTDRTTVRHHTANRFTNGRPKPGTDLEHLGKRKLKVKKIVNLSTIWEQSTCQTSPCSSWATVFKTVRPMLSDRRPVLSVCNVGVLWPNGWNFWIDQNKTLHGDRPRPRPHCVGWELISPKGHSPPPIFGPCMLWSNGWMDKDATWYRGRPRSRPHCVGWGPNCPQRGTAPQFSAHVCRGQTAG